MKKVIMIFFAVIILTLAVTAHPGRTDSKGGHYDRQNGGYHYHHGHPAHQHTNGECPYDFDTQTQESKENPSEEKSLQESNKDQDANTAQNKNKNTKIEEIVAIVFAVLFLFFIYIGLPLIIEHKTKIKNFFSKIWGIICDFYTDKFEIIWIVIIFVGMLILIAFFGKWLDKSEDSKGNTTSTFYYENIDKDILNPPSIDTSLSQWSSKDMQSLIDSIIEPKQ